MERHTVSNKNWVVFWVVIFTLALGAGGFFAVRAVIEYDSYAKYTQVFNKLEGKYEHQNFFLNAGESVSFDINERIKDIGFKPKKIEFDGTGFEYDSKNKTITATKGTTAIGGAELSIRIFNGKNKEIHEIIIAQRYVYDIENSIEIKTAQDLANISQNPSGGYILKDKLIALRQEKLMRDIMPAA